ncbi:unnamed protein product [Caenorhabditis bovis]|uniref:MPN domain-containing protein n=1 Tax=Caenorhabditis bovis TaxID=2654633 RepID=A0A8S1F2U9_9PELO|nr:unnamed protein product [Caenorhabditis bovis]
MLEDSNTIDPVLLDPSVRLRQLIGSAEQMKVNPGVPLLRYYQALLDMDKMAKSYIEEISLEKAFILLYRFSWFSISELKKHPEFPMHDSPDKRKVYQLIKSNMEMTETLKSRIKHVYSTQADYYQYEEQQRKMKNENFDLWISKREEAAREAARLYKIAEEVATKSGMVMGKMMTLKLVPDDVHVKSVNPTLLPARDEKKMLPPKPNNREKVRDPEEEEVPAKRPIVAASPPITPGTSSSSAFRPVQKHKDEQFTFAPMYPDLSENHSGFKEPEVPIGSRQMEMPSDLVQKFLDTTADNTTKNIETCGILGGKLINQKFRVSHVILPKQTGTANGCSSENDVEIAAMLSNSNLLSLGWIHTHPTQTAFLSSVDLHTQYVYQQMIPEAVAVVAAPSHNEVGTFILTPEGMNTLSSCSQRGFHPHTESVGQLFTAAKHKKVAPKCVEEGNATKRGRASKKKLSEESENSEKRISDTENIPEKKPKNDVEIKNSDESMEDPAQEVSLNLSGDKIEEDDTDDQLGDKFIKIERPRRSVASRRSYVPSRAEDDMILFSTSSSSSDIDSSSDDNELSFKEEVKKEKKRENERQNAIRNTRKKATTNKHDSTLSTSDDDMMSEASDSGMEEIAAKNKKKATTVKSSGRCRKQSSSKSSAPKKMKSGGGKSTLRVTAPAKPEQPWKKNLAAYEKDRKKARGERKMAEYRVVARALARGRIEEISYEECYALNCELKRVYQEGVKLLEAVEKRKREEETGEKEDSSEDEWEEMEHFEPVIDDNIEVTLHTEENMERDWWVVYLRQETNRCIRNVWENTHKTHLLCYMCHLHQLVKTGLDELLAPSLMVSQLPSGYSKYIGETLPNDVLLKLVKWYADSFRPLNGFISVTAIEAELKKGQEARYPATSRLTALINKKCFETDCDRAVLLFCLLVGMEATARICVNVKAISRRWDKDQQVQLRAEMDKFRECSKSRSQTPKLEDGKTSTKSKKGKTKQKEIHVERNYWVEYWNPREKRWICVDPLVLTVDEPLKIGEEINGPISYVFAVDNKRGICEVTQRYAVDCVKQDFRRRRTDTRWINTTLRLPIFAANEERRKWEKMHMNEELIKRPLPTTLSEYKNHPLYVLEKDLLKFEAIYPPPETQKPLGTIRGHNVYPRSCVYTLQGENNWLKLARSVKIGEKPYKVVKARPDFRVPAEDRVQQYLNVYGYWQTEPYRRPKAVNGKIPRNEYGNVYMFSPTMCPIGCVHLKLPGLVQIARKINKECSQAVVGWAFDGGWTHPVMDGAIVLEKDVESFVKEWSRIECGRAANEEAKRLERVYGNWKTLIKGALRLKYVKDQFALINKDKKKTDKLKLDEDGPSTSTNLCDQKEEIIDNSAAIKPLDGFSLDDFIKVKK